MLNSSTEFSALILAHYFDYFQNSLDQACSLRAFGKLQKKNFFFFLLFYPPTPKQSDQFKNKEHSASAIEQ